MKGFGRPVVFNWNMTTSCHHDCSFCGNASRKRTVDALSRDEAIQLVEEIGLSGVHHIWFSGGEPFLKKYFLEVLSKAFDIGLRVGVTTTGTVLTEKGLELLQVWRSQLDHFNVSIHGHTRDLYMMVHRVDQLHVATRNLRSLAEAHIPFNINLVVGQYNIEYVVDICRFLTSFGPNRINFLPLRPVGGGQKMTHDQVGFSQLLGVFSDVDKEIKMGNIVPVKYVTKDIVAGPFKSAFPNILVQRDSCSAHSVLHMDADGDMRICTHLTDLGLNSELVSKFTASRDDKGTLLSSWESDNLGAFRRHMYQAIRHESCIVCPSFSSGRCTPCSFRAPNCVSELKELGVIPEWAKSCGEGRNNMSRIPVTLVQN